MKKLSKTAVLLSTIILFSCKDPEARKPVSYSTGEFVKESVKRNREVFLSESKMIQQMIRKDSASKYYESKTGFWYKYIKANINDTVTPKTNDIVEIEFDIKDIDGTVIYTKAETSPQIYIVDKQDIMVGLRHAIKLMRSGETILFIFPSHMGYGLLGDKNKIGQDQPIITEVTLKKIKKQ